MPDVPHDTLVGARNLSIQQAWIDGAEPYLGVALHGFPNYFMVGGPDFGAAMRYVVECLQLMGGTAVSKCGAARNAYSTNGFTCDNHRGGWLPRRSTCRRPAMSTKTRTKARQP